MEIGLAVWIVCGLVAWPLNFAIEALDPPDIKRSCAKTPKSNWLAWSLILGPIWLCCCVLMLPIALLGRLDDDPSGGR